MGRQTVTKASRNSRSKRTGKSLQPHVSPFVPSGPNADVLALQHSAGNRAVDELLETESGNAFTGDDYQGTLQAPNNRQIVVDQSQPNVEALYNRAPACPLQDSVDLPSSGGASQPEVSAPSPAKAPTTGGHPLDPSTRREMEAGFGVDFSHVRLHTDIAAQQRAMVADFAAVTEGAHIYLGPQYRAGTARGRSLLAHELTHVRQQSPGPLGIAERGRDALEGEAREVSARVASGGKAGVVGAGTVPHGAPQGDTAGEFEVHFRGKSGEKGIGVLFVEGWSKLTPLEKESILAFAREMDFEASSSGITRQKVDATMRSVANRAARVSREMLGLGSGTAGGHLPDVTAGQQPIAPVTGMPSRVNSSFGGQWRRYEHGFNFNGVSIYDADTGQWVYNSHALEHTPPPAPKGRPVGGGGGAETNDPRQRRRSGYNQADAATGRWWTAPRGHGHRKNGHVAQTVKSSGHHVAPIIEPAARDKNANKAGADRTAVCQGHDYAKSGKSSSNRKTRANHYSSDEDGTDHQRQFPIYDTTGQGACSYADRRSALDGSDDSAGSVIGFWGPWTCDCRHNFPRWRPGVRSAEGRWGGVCDL